MAIQGGVTAEGSPYVVAMNIRLTATTGQRCTGGLLTEQIVVTAGHCVVNNGQPISSDSIQIFAPGSNVDVPLKTNLVRVFFPDNYVHRTNNAEPNDIAFLVFDSKIGEPQGIQLANFDTVLKIVSSNTPIKLFGYGITGKGEGASNLPKVINETPIEQIGLIGFVGFVGFVGFEKTYINYAQKQEASACSGDSGGPAIANYQGKTYLVSVHSASSGVCANSSSEVDSNWGTIPGEFSQLFDQALSLAPTVLVKPQVAASPSPSASPSITETPIVVAPNKAVTKKTIICAKGKTTKKVVGTNPKCPSGYKKKS
jgi:secreted trypsin-like serine protease